MSSLSETVARLSAMRGTLQPGKGSSMLEELTGFGSNPGALRGWVHVPADLPPSAPLVIVLHGCTQTAAGYDHGAGWSQLADRHGFVLLYPEQERANNPNLCFNWFGPEDMRRDAGEPLSIRQMIAAMTDRHTLDPTRVFVTGLSAGGAMSSVMLACYPELFAGGAIIAGLPYGVARSIPQALERMREQGGADAARLAGLVRAASTHTGSWPTVSVWHGDADATVAAANADAIVAQWRALRGLPEQPSAIDMRDGYPRKVWRDHDGREVIEQIGIAGMGHGTPLSTLGADACGHPGAHMLEVGTSSTRHIARFWGLLKDGVDEVGVERPTRRATAEPDAPSRTKLPIDSVEQVIGKALRAAGLMR